MNSNRRVGLQCDEHVLVGLLHVEALLRGDPVFLLFCGVCFSVDVAKAGSQLFAKSLRLASSPEEARSSLHGTLLADCTSLSLADVASGLKRCASHVVHHVSIPRSPLNVLHSLVLADGQRFVIVASAYTGAREYDDDDIKCSSFHFDVLDSTGLLEMATWNAREPMSHSKGHVLRATTRSLTETGDLPAIQPSTSPAESSAAAHLPSAAIAAPPDVVNIAEVP
jgi:hypothetical protein